MRIVYCVKRNQITFHISFASFLSFLPFPFPFFCLLVPLPAFLLFPFFYLTINYQWCYTVPQH